MNSGSVNLWSSGGLSKEFNFANAVVAVDSGYMTASLSVACSSFSLPSNFVSGRVLTKWFMVCHWPQSQEGAVHLHDMGPEQRPRLKNGKYLHTFFIGLGRLFLMSAGEWLKGKLPWQQESRIAVEMLSSGSHWCKQGLICRGRSIRESWLARQGEPFLFSDETVWARAWNTQGKAILTAVLSLAVGLQMSALIPNIIIIIIIFSFIFVSIVLKDWRPSPMLALGL